MPDGAGYSAHGREVASRPASKRSEDGGPIRTPLPPRPPRGPRDDWRRWLPELGAYRGVAGARPCSAFTTTTTTTVIISPGAQLRDHVGGRTKAAGADGCEAAP